jgi:hypothetical protein
LGNESFPLAFLSKWSCGQHALTKYKQLLSTTTESPQSHEQMTSQVPDVSQTFGGVIPGAPKGNYPNLTVYICPECCQYICYWPLSNYQSINHQTTL